MWKDFILEESKKEYFHTLLSLVDESYKYHTCYPKYDEIFEAFKLTPLANVKVVILGQDPYHEEGQAHGLAFSVKCAKIPPSLVNIYKEMASDLGVEVKQNGDLTYLAKEGVLLLNASLTVEKGKAHSHEKFGWQTFTDNVLKHLNKIDRPMVFILWGNDAIKKKKFLDNPLHLILTSAHPSPLSCYRGFFGSKPFSKTNTYLKEHNMEEIKWLK